jgi:hypothetical protein
LKGIWSGQALEDGKMIEGELFGRYGVEAEGFEEFGWGDISAGTFESGIACIAECIG